MIPLSSDPGRSQVLMGLVCADQLSLNLRRMPHQDMSVAVRYKAAPANAPVVAEQLLAQSRTNPTTWKYTFATLHELHIFQKCLTGADVIFDGIASSFRVSRGHGLRTKNEELGNTRLQLLINRSNHIFQLHAYFEDGQAMNLSLGANDTFEKVNTKGKFSIKLVDARVSPPTEEEDLTKRGFLCVEDIAEGSEKEDITISFDGEYGRDVMAQMLPASVKRASSLMGALHLK